LATLLFSLYVSNIPSTLLKQFQYPDDIALTNQHDESFENLEVDLERLNQYFHRWRLQPNPSKTESCVFHLSIHHANRTLEVQFAATQIQHVEHPKYLGVTLDQSLTYNTHLSKTAKKVAARVNLVAETDYGTNWGASAGTLRTAEYCAPPVWLNSVHTNKIDIQLKSTMRLISGTVKSTQLEWLPVLANIAPSKLRRKATTVRKLVSCRRHARSLLYEQMLDILDQR
jgi:hypothetical protein